MRAWGSTVAHIERLLSYGPCTALELAHEIGITKGQVSPVLTRMRRVSASGPKRIHITRWETRMEGSRPYLRAVYALGDRPNAARPKPKTEAASSRDYRTRTRKQVSSVFEWRGSI